MLRWVTARGCVRACQVMRALGWHWSERGDVWSHPRSVQIRRRKMTLQRCRRGLKGCRCVAVVFVVMDNMRNKFGWNVMEWYSYGQSQGLRRTLRIK
jgi:hypothetical protein